MTNILDILKEIDIIIKRKEQFQKKEKWLIIGAGEERDYKAWNEYIKDKNIEWCGLNVDCFKNDDNKCCIPIDDYWTKLKDIIIPNTYDKIFFDRGVIEWLDFRIKHVEILYNGLTENGKLYIPFVIFPMKRLKPMDWKSDNINLETLKQKTLNDLNDAIVNISNNRKQIKKFMYGDMLTADITFNLYIMIRDNVNKNIKKKAYIHNNTLLSNFILNKMNININKDISDIRDINIFDIVCINDISDLYDITPEDTQNFLDLLQFHKDNYIQLQDQRVPQIEEHWILKKI